VGIWVGIDYGTKRIGVAYTDTAKIIASPLGTFSPLEIRAELKKLHDKYTIELIVLGEPTRADGSAGTIEEDIQAFIKLLLKDFPSLKIEREDERYSSKLSLDAMLAGGTSKKYRKDKKNLDKISATIILQSFMERKQYF